MTIAVVGPSNERRRGASPRLVAFAPPRATASTFAGARIGDMRRTSLHSLANVDESFLLDVAGCDLGLITQLTIEHDTPSGAAARGGRHRRANGRRPRLRARRPHRRRRPKAPFSSASSTERPKGECGNGLPAAAA